jgi:serine/threonine protein kinase
LKGHRNIVTLVRCDILECDVDVKPHDCHQLVFEFANKGNLENFLKGNLHKLSTFDQSCIMLDVAEGLAAIHQAGFIHRDPVPKNMLVKSFAQSKCGLVVKWADFGSSMRMKDARNCLKGSPIMSAYVDPALKDRPIYAEYTDIYGIGMLLGQVTQQNLNLSREEIFHSKDSSLAMRLAWKCVQPDISKRPSAQAVGDELRAHRDKLFHMNKSSIKFQFELDMKSDDDM